MNKINFISSKIANNPAPAIFALIFLLTSLNAIFNSLATSLGYGFPYTTFLFLPEDRFADYFKVIFSYPGTENIDLSGTANVLIHFLHDNPYQGQADLAGGALTHFHMPPLTTLISLLNLKLMYFINPIAIFVSIFLIGFILVYKLINYISESTLDTWLVFLATFFCYPTLFMITRGHIFSGFSSLALLAFLVFMFEGKRKYLSLILLAIAINLRPNAIIFLFALGMCDFKNLKKDIPMFILISAIIFLISLFLTNIMYPDYSVDNMLLAIGIYHDQYVIGNGGLAFGSSLFGPLKVIFGYSKVIEALPILIAGLMVVISTLQLRNKAISKIAFLFILCSSYVLGSAVIADYHLTVFFAPLLCIYLEQKKALLKTSYPLLNKELLIVFFASVFMLCPKNYIYIKHTSIQVALNPLLLLVASILIIILGCLNSRYNQSAK
jgi:hypothetical protein